MFHAGVEVGDSESFRCEASKQGNQLDDGRPDHLLLGFPIAGLQDQLYYFPVPGKHELPCRASVR